MLSLLAASGLQGYKKLCVRSPHGCLTHRYTTAPDGITVVVVQDDHHALHTPAQHTVVSGVVERVASGSILPVPD